MRALVLAAGLGTRMGLLSDELPKPLLPVCDIALIRYALALLAGHGVTEVAVNLHHRGDQIERELGDGRALGLALTYSREDPILGTGGAIRRLMGFLTHDGRSACIVINAKIVVDLDLAAVCARHQESGALGTVVLKESPDAAAWGAIEVDPVGRVTSILGQGRPGARACMFTGVHILSPALIARLPDQAASDSIRQAYLPALLEGEHIASYLHAGYFQEHSTPARYLHGNLNILAGHAQLRHAPGQFVGLAPTAVVAGSSSLHPPFRIGDGAVVEAGAVIGPNVVVGGGARVRAGVRLERVVVWRAAVADSNLRDAIVTPKGVHLVDSDPHLK